MAAIFIRTFLIYLFLSIAIRIMGKRQIGELETNELISTLVISEVVALPIADPDIPLLNAVVPVLLIVCMEIILSFIKNKSEGLKKYVEGEPLFLVYNGELKQDALADTRISVNELLCEIRMQGIAGIEDVGYAILEQNGKISVFKNSDSEHLSHPIIVDGELKREALGLIGKDEGWLKNILRDADIVEKDVFLLTATDNGKTHLVRKEKPCEIG